ncbi:regulatory protein AfsR [Parachaetomium inaequale]|uniref:Regulatory protein AfsR n=1 Tax=Parachaetomium inaequale TaxID=2588326 RepID=A0AAN6PJD5_9PEZI|nr:regulatory protein AfsR [Parachaetomium inaequale]
MEPPSSRENFQIGIVCALPLEFDAVVASLDQIWDEDVCAALGKAPGDANTYTHGRMKQHNVVVALLRQRGGKPTMGKANAAIVASDLRHSYCSLSLALLVGICGGVPKAENKEMLLGDVVISSSVQGPQNSLATPMAENASILGILNTHYEKESVRVKTASFLAALQHTRPDAFALANTPNKPRMTDAVDHLVYEASYRHKHQKPRDCQCQHHQKEADAVCEAALEGSCEDLGCSDDFLVHRSRLEERLAATADDDAVLQPAIFLGGVATGYTVMKSGVTLDAVAKAEGIIAFEMEAAGIWEQLPTLIIKAVCDYADSHKNKKWQTYAAGTAAAAAKAVAALHTPADMPRLREMKAAQRESILPFPPDPEFISRPQISGWIKEKAKIPGGRAALVGLGGIGKSQLAIRHAHGVRNRSHVFWINATTRVTLEESVRTLAEGLNLEKPGDSLDDIFRRVGSWLGCEKNGLWTVVLRKLLPLSSNGFTLITSRDIKAAERLTGSGKNMIYLVPDLGEEAALELFQAKLENRCEREEAEEVVRLLEFMPLAISQAAAYINNRADRISVRDYADMFRAGNEKRGALLEWEYDELRRYQTSPNSIFGTWTITLEQMQQEKPSAVDLLSLMSFFNSQSIPVWALKPFYMYDIDIGRRFLHRTSIEGGIQSDMWSLWATPDKGAKEEKDKGDSKEETGKTKTGKPKKSRWSDMTKLTGKAIRRQPRRFREDLKEVPIKEQMLRLKDELIHEILPSFDRTKDDGAKDDGDRGDLDLLRKYSMVTPTAKDGVVKMHPLVRYCTHNWLSRSETLDGWKRRFLTIMVACLVRPPPGHELHTGNLDGHIEFLTDEKPGDVATARPWEAVCTHLVSRWQERGSKDPAVVLALQEKMVDVAYKMLGPGDRVTIANRAWLASYALEKGELEKAGTMFEEVLEQAQNVQGRDSSQAIECRLQYVGILRAQGWKYGAHSTAAHAESLAAEGRFDDAARLAMQALDNPKLISFQSQFGKTMACLAGVTEAMSRHSPPEEVAPLLFKIVNHAERVGQMWPHFAFTVCGPFHRHLAVCLERQGDVAGALLVMRKGISNMAFTFPGPAPPARAVADELLRAPADEEETRQRLLREMVQCLDSDNGRFSDVFLHIDRFGECWTLLDAMCDHMLAEWGETHLLTKAVLGLRDDMKKWHVEAGRMAREAREGRDADSKEKEPAAAAAVAAQRRIKC